MELFSSSCGGFGGRRRGCGRGGGFSLALLFVSPFLFFFFFQSGSLRKKEGKGNAAEGRRGKKKKNFPLVSHKKNKRREGRGGKTLFSHSFETDTLGGIKKVSRSKSNSFGFSGGKHPVLQPKFRAFIPRYIMLVFMRGKHVASRLSPFLCSPISLRKRRRG